MDGAAEVVAAAVGGGAVGASDVAEDVGATERPADGDVVAEPCPPPAQAPTNAIVASSATALADPKPVPILAALGRTELSP